MVTCNCAINELHSCVAPLSFSAVKQSTKSEYNDYQQIGYSSANANYQPIIGAFLHSTMTFL